MQKTEKNSFDKCFKGERIKPTPIDEYYRYLAYPIVAFLAKLKFIKPPYVVVVGFLLKIFVVLALIRGDVGQIEAVMLFMAIILDYVDGMLARVTDNVSEFGGLLDLGADIISSILLFVGLGVYMGYSSFIDIGLIIVSFLCFIFPMEVWSYTKWKFYNKSKSIDEFINLEIQNGSNLLSKIVLCLYDITWKKFAIWAFEIFKIEKLDLKGWLFHLFALSSIGMNLTVLTVVIFFQANIEIYIYYQLVAFLIFYFLSRRARAT